MRKLNLLHCFSWVVFISSFSQLSIAASINGGEGNDTLTGTSNSDTINGRSGNDTIDGREGNDFIITGLGSDTAFGSSGSDLLVSGQLTSGSSGGLQYIYQAVKVVLLAGEGDDAAVFNSQLSSGSQIDGGPGLDSVNIASAGGGRTAQEYAYITGFENWILTGNQGIDAKPLIINSPANNGYTDLVVENSDVYITNANVIGLTQQLTLFAESDFYGRTIDASAVSESGVTFRFFTNGNPNSSSYVFGSQENDTYFGAASIDVFKGGGGDDWMDGRDNTDVAVFSGNKLDYAIEEITYNTFRVSDLRANSPDGTDTIVDVNKLTFADQSTDVVIRGISIVGDDSSENLTGGAEGDFIDGAGGNDILSGAGGNDTIIAGVGSDTVNGGDGSDYITGGEGADSINGGSGSDSVLYDGSPRGVSINLSSGSGSGGDAAGDAFTSIENVTGSSSADTLIGSSGNNTIDGGAGADQLNGGAGADALSGGDGTDTASYIGSVNGVAVSLATGTGSGGDAAGDVLTSIENLIGSASSDTLIGDADHNTLVGGGSGDVIDGGQGLDTVSYEDSTVGVVINLSSGTGSGGDATGDALTSIENVVGSAQGDTITGNTIDNVISTGGGNDSVTSNSGNDIVNTGAGDDLIIGGNGAGNDSYDGGSGTDTVRYTSAIASITVNLETGSANATVGNDAAQIGVDTLSNIENVVAGPFNDTLRGTVANNSFNGSGGSDTAVFSGTDTDYTITYDGASGALTVADKIAGRDGIDTLVLVETLQFSNGNKLASLYAVNKVQGTAAANTLNGTVGTDEILGLDGNDTLNGNAGDDTLDGGTGGDTMNGGDGNDIFVVDSTSDVVTEGSGANSGNDTVRTTLASYTLPANVENVIYIGTGAFTGTGNSLVNSMTGGAGSDSLNGSTAADTMLGGGGNDNYTFDANGDTAIEGVNAGTDSVSATVTVTLADNVENLTLTGSSNLSGTGNSIDNILTGNSGVNTLTGGGGSDTLNGGTGGDGMYGGEGDDNYTVDNAADITGEDAGKGTDRVSSSVTRTLADHLEHLTLTGSSAINGTGNSLNNRIVGNSGANTLSGAAGEDVLIGAAGNDIFYGNTSSTVGTEIDTVSYEGTTAAVTFNLGLTTAQATGGSGSDRVPNGSIENLIGGSAADTLTGTSGDNRIEGAAGNDKLNGLTGADVFIGNAGLDTIDCGSETTNAVDTVVYLFSGDSAVGTNRDQILNFKTGDKIDLSAIDANSSAANDQAFTFNTTTAKANSIWFAVSGSDVIVRGDVNGNTTADFEILVKGMTSITAAQFVM